jgi:hypothetical protein
MTSKFLAMLAWIFVFNEFGAKKKKETIQEVKNNLP